MKEIMTPDHPRWEEFMEKLAGPDGCNLDPEKDTWECHHDFRFAKKILSSMPEIDVEESLLFFKRHGGYCDCEIGFNVTTDVEELENPEMRHHGDDLLQEDLLQ